MRYLLFAETNIIDARCFFFMRDVSHVLICIFRYLWDTFASNGKCFCYKMVLLTYKQQKQFYNKITVSYLHISEIIPICTTSAVHFVPHMWYFLQFYVCKMYHICGIFCIIRECNLYQICGIFYILSIAFCTTYLVLFASLILHFVSHMWYLLHFYLL